MRQIQEPFCKCVFNDVNVRFGSGTYLKLQTLLIFDESGNILMTFEYNGVPPT